MTPLPLIRQSPGDPAFYADPYPAYRQMRAAGPLFIWEDYGFPCSARHDVVAAALKDRRFGREVLHVATREDLGWPPVSEAAAPFYALERHSMLEREPPAHTRLRGLVNRAFVSRNVERLRADVVSLADRLIDRFEADGRTDLIESFATPIPLAMICGLLGVPLGDGDRLLAWSHAMVAMYQFGRDEAVERAASDATRAFSNYVADLIAARRRSPGADLLSDLIAARDAGDRLGDDELTATVILLLNAGHEATVHAIGNGVHAVLASGADVTAVQNGEALAEECLRFDPPLHLFTRYALDDLAFAGHRFRRGDRIGLLLAAAGRDPARFPEPDRFDPQREPGAHLAFGAGIHFCVGAPLARLELQVAIPALFRRLPALRLSNDLRWRPSYHFRGVQRLNVEWEL
jgi:cytochrome P450